MNRFSTLGVLLISLGTHSFARPLDCASSSESIDEKTQKITITCTPQDKEVLLHDSLAFSIDNPHYAVTHWDSTAPVDKYSATRKETKRVHTDPMTIQVTIQQNDSNTDNATLHMHYMTNVTKEPTEYLVPLMHHAAQVEETHTAEMPKKNIPLHLKKVSFKARVFQKMHDGTQAVFTTLKKWGTQLSDRIRGTNSLPLQFLLVFLLGILMSLTPCIYPMIPVTIGILQANSAQSVIKNFLIALSYTVGVATTFAFLGFLAATGSAQFGQLAGNPVFIIIIVAILGYLGLSMFGWYEMYIPRFLQPKDTKIKQGSPIAAFIFGAISGTIASPCLSPGLAFVLTIVAGLKSSLLGLALLFAFGVGSSLPLLIIGTFSTSLNVLPRAGSWMVEVKKLFGFMLFGMCFYYLSVIIPTPVLLGIISSFLVIKGVWYFMHITKHDSKSMKRYKNGMGFLLVTGAVIILFQASKDWTCAPVVAHTSVCHTNYKLALDLARAEHKNLLLDFTADWCSVCKMIEKNVLNAPEFLPALDHVIPVTINSTHANREPYATLKNKYTIVGVPTLILVDSQTGEALRQWGSELLDMDVMEFVQQLR